MPAFQSLSPDDIEDIRTLLPVHGARYVADWLGCARWTVCWHAKRMGITDWPRKVGPRRPSLAAQDVPGVSKVCTGCQESKPLGEYHKHPLGRFGCRPRCKKCSAGRRR